MQLGDKNNRQFKTMATIKKSQNTIQEIKDNYGNWFEDQNITCRVSSDKFNRRFRRDLEVTPQDAVPLSRDMIYEDNLLLTIQAKNQEIYQTVKQISK